MNDEPKHDDILDGAPAGGGDGQQEQPPETPPVEAPPQEQPAPPAPETPPTPTGDGVAVDLSGPDAADRLREAQEKADREAREQAEREAKEKERVATREGERDARTRAAEEREKAAAAANVESEDLDDGDDGPVDETLSGATAPGGALMPNADGTLVQHGEPTPGLGVTPGEQPPPQPQRVSEGVYEPDPVDIDRPDIGTTVEVTEVEILDGPEPEGDDSVTHARSS